MLIAADEVTFNFHFEILNRNTMLYLYFISLWNNNLVESITMNFLCTYLVQNRTTQDIFPRALQTTNHLNLGFNYRIVNINGQTGLS